MFGTGITEFRLFAEQQAAIGHQQTSILCYTLFILILCLVSLLLCGCVFRCRTSSWAQEEFRLASKERRTNKAERAQLRQVWSWQCEHNARLEERLADMDRKLGEVCRAVRDWESDSDGGSSSHMSSGGRTPPSCKGSAVVAPWSGSGGSLSNLHPPMAREVEGAGEDVVETEGGV